MFSGLTILITGDEKWVLYAYHNSKRQWCAVDQVPEPTPTPGLHPKKVMLLVWWDVVGVTNWELLAINTTAKIHLSLSLREMNFKRHSARLDMILCTDEVALRPTKIT